MLARQPETRIFRLIKDIFLCRVVGLYKYQFQTTLIHRRSKTDITQFEICLIFLAGFRSLGQDSFVEHQTITETLHHLIHRTIGSPHFGNRFAIITVEIGPVVLLHFGDSIRSIRIGAFLASLTTHDGIFAIFCPEITIGCSLIRPYIRRRGNETVVMSAYTGFVSRLMRIRFGERFFAQSAHLQVFHLKGRCTKCYLSFLRNGT